MRCDKRNSVVQLRILKLGKLQDMSFRIWIFKYSLHFKVLLWLKPGVLKKYNSSTCFKCLWQAVSETNPLENDLHPQGLSKNFHCKICKTSVVTKSIQVVIPLLSVLHMRFIWGRLEWLENYSPKTTAFEKTLIETNLLHSKYCINL